MVESMKKLWNFIKKLWTKPEPPMPRDQWVGKKMNELNRKGKP